MITKEKMEKKKSKYGTPHKDLFDVRQIVREEINSMIKQGSGEYQELKYVLQPMGFKAEVRRIIEGELDSIRKEMYELMEDPKRNPTREFKEDVFKAITQQVKAEIKNADINELTEELIKQKIDSQMFRDIISMVVEKFVRNINRKLEKDYRNSKDLCYSIDAEIKHTLMRLPISAQSEGEIKTRIMEILNSNNTKRIPSPKDD